MSKTKLALAVLLTTGLAAAPFAAGATSHKTKHRSSTSSTTTTGANMKSGTMKSNNPSSQGNVGPGTNQAGSMPSK
jgi:hypothetical protein